MSVNLELPKTESDYEDPIVAEIHAHRQALSERFNGDMSAIGDYMRERQELERMKGRQIVDLSN